MAAPQEVRDYVHAQVHRAKMFSFTFTDPAVSDGASAGVVIKTSDDDLHMAFGVIAGGSARVMLYEEPVMTASTVATAWNMNREKKTATGASVGHTPTFTTGSVIFDVHIPGAAKQVGGGGEVRGNSEWILDENTTYILAACNAQGATAGMTFDIEYYEH